MSKKLLIDARQSDETRVVVLNNNTLEDFDYETSHRRQLKGNIYLARVTRVEPSLQAAFVEYGGNRHGFLAFSEIHPDYYRIPVEDREKLLAEEEDRAKAAATEDNGVAKDDTAAKDVQDNSVSEKLPEEPGDDPSGDDGDVAPENDSNNGDDEDDARATRRKHSRVSRHYKIQEVISNRQILLVQVVKEERGTKGAALTTYLSLAGRYCVLMPNTFHGGGVSRKISNPADRKKLKTIVSSLKAPKGMAVIVRTAGSKRTKAEITRDYTYLSRQWDEIRALTMESSAPSLIHEEGNLVKRSIRDYYSADIDEIIVDGEDAHKAAKGHMRNLIPSHVKKVKAYEDETTPLFQHYQIESMLSDMHEPVVTLKSGGYLVINQTEALVAIDVNSGRATRGRHIEETALKTNIEAAAEIAKQLRQRDLSGLIVIDFIDMESNRNQNAVERKLRDALRDDRARLQTGSISQFGLLEMSRQRLRPSLAEAVSNLCPHCNGTGRVRSVESGALQALRAIEAEALKGKKKDLYAFANAEIAIYILNSKRAMIAALEERFGIKISIDQDNTLVAPDVRFGDAEKSSSKQPGNRDGSRRKNRGKPPQNTSGNTGGRSGGEQAASDDQDAEDKPRRRRGRRRGRRRQGREQAASENESQENINPSQDRVDEDTEAAGDKPKTAKKAVSKTAKKSAGKTKAKTSAAEADDEAKGEKKAKSKKAKNKTAAGSDTAKTKDKTSKGDDAEGRKTASSAAVNVVDVSAVAPASKKKGWWN
jgi:ribonuclease E